MSITPERKKELDLRYAKQVSNATTNQEVVDAWMRYLVILWREDGNYEIFRELSEIPRDNGARIDRELLAGEKTRRQAFHAMRALCCDIYAASLNRYGLAEIDITSDVYRVITKDLVIQVLRAFRDVDPTSKTEVCTAMAKTWHRYVQRLHAQYGLPSPEEMSPHFPARSPAEKDVLADGDFETRMTLKERADFEAEVE